MLGFQAFSNCSQLFQSLHIHSSAHGSGLYVIQSPEYGFGMIIFGNQYFLVSILVVSFRPFGIRMQTLALFCMLLP